MLMTLSNNTVRTQPACDLALLPQRNYDPTIGRLTSMDTYEGETDEPLTLHRYIYVQDDPVNNIDPSGHTTKREGQAAHKVIGAIYKFDHPGSLVDTSIKPYVGGKKKLADIINFTGNTIDTGLLAEIKTPGEVGKGDRQLRGYLVEYNSRHVANNTWLRDSAWDPSLKVFWLGAADSGLSKTFGVIVGNLNGVIVYQTFDKGTPPPDPLPIPLPIAEQITNDIYSYDTNSDFGDILNPRPRPVPVLPREVIQQRILTGTALGTAYFLARVAVPAIAGYLELGVSVTVTTSIV